MPPMYIGGPGPQTNWGTGPIVSRGPFSSDGSGGGGVGSGGGGGNYSGLPASTTVPNPTPPNVLGAQAVRPTGLSGGFDPSYLQNLATAIGGLFSRPGGALNFNPLGNLSEISPPTGFGNAPLPGLPNTMLQDAINGLAFMFNQPPSSPVGAGGGFGNNGGGGGGGTGTGNNGGRGRIPILQ